MPAALIGVCLLSVLSLCVVNVMAVAPCDQNIINNLRAKSSCYPGGVPPSQMAAAILYTQDGITSGELPPLTKCATASQRNGMAYVNIFLTTGLNIPITYKHEFKGDHILETDSIGGKFRIYVFLNENNVFSYHRCIESGALGNGSPMGVILIGCKFVNDGKAQAAVAKSKSCFNQLGINNLINVTPCVC